MQINLRYNLAMSVNESKANLANIAAWEKWRATGSIGTLLSAVTQPIKNEAKEIVAIGVSVNPDGTPIQSTLSIGEQVIYSSGEYQVTQPELYVVVPGYPFGLGEMIKASDLPEGTQTISQAFGNQRK